MVYFLIYGHYIIPISKGKYICRNGIDKLLHFFKINYIHIIYRTTNTYTVEGGTLDFILDINVGII